MPHAFNILRIFGIFPYRIDKDQPCLCFKWRLYSYILALFAESLVCYRGLVYLQSSDIVELTSTSFVYQFLIKIEPTFAFLHMTVIYYTAFDTKRHKKNLKLLNVLLQLQSKHKGRGGRTIIRVTLINLSVLAVCALTLHFLDAHYSEGITWVHLVDFTIGFFNTSTITLQLLQFSVFIDMIIDLYTHLECSSDELVYEKLDTIKKLRYVLGEFEQIYYPSIILQQLSFFIYSVLGFRAFYDFALQQYLSPLHSICLTFWIVIDIPHQLYLMHLCDVAHRKVSLSRMKLKYLNFSIF